VEPRTIVRGRRTAERDEERDRNGDFSHGADRTRGRAPCLVVTSCEGVVISCVGRRTFVREAAIAPGTIAEWSAHVGGELRTHLDERLRPARPNPRRALNSGRA
jgi:hypothetical protein